MTAPLPFSCAPLASPSQQLFFSPLDLVAQAPLITGGERFIYLHPNDPHLLVKVVNEQERAQRRAKHPVKHWFKQFRRHGYQGYLAELAEYAASQTLANKRLNIPLARVLGLVQTTAGLGLLTEKITASDGGLAPTLREVVHRDGLRPSLRADLDAFFHTLAEAHVVINDLGPSNIVVGYNAQGRAGLWLIDGFGNKQAIPLFALNKRWNRLRIMRKYGEMMVKLERIARDRQPFTQIALDTAFR